MSQPLAPYPDYKPAGLPWLDKVPTHWEIKRAKQVFRTIDQRSETGLEEKLTVSSKNGVVPRREQKVTMFMAASYVGHKLCWPGDLVVNSLWAWANGLGFAKHHGIISTAYSVYRPLPEYNEAGPYLDYLLRSSAFQWEFQIGSKGIWISRLQLTDDTFMRMPMLLPPLPEQQQMVKFLDAKGRQIALLLRHKRQLIKLLNEQKQALIHRAVTQGLDADAPRRESSVDWVEEIPAHWEIKRLKSISKRITDGAHISPDTTSDDYHFISTVDIKDGAIDFSKSLMTTKKSYEYLVRTGCRPNEGDVLYSKDGTIGRTALINFNKDFVVASSLIIITPKERSVSSPFLQFALQSNVCTNYVESLLSGSAIRRISIAKVENMPIIIPPIDEQKEILNFIQTETAVVIQAISRTQREIELIQEYRTRLIDDVVTGRLDVRHLADAASGLELPAENELELEDEENEEETVLETEDGRD